MKAWSWFWFVAVQLIMLLSAMLGWLLLIPFCLAQAWVRDQTSIKDQRPIDRWRCKLLDAIYGNPEDGVSGQCALIWANGVQAPYMPDARAAWRAWCWSAWRNSADNLKYVFAWEQGPLATFTLFGKPHKMGWQEENGRKVPVFS